MRKMTIATRGSRLALWQAEYIKGRLEAEHHGLEVELLVLKTRGDVLLDVPLAKVGGKGLFVKEIEEALLDGRADLAVHSMKDVPMLLPEGLILSAVPEREDCRDIFLSHGYDSLEDLPQGAILGTSSLRRQAQAMALRPDLNVTMLRGNVETRLRKLAEGQYHAIILAAAGMKRLGLGAPRQKLLCAEEFLPAVGQGALGVEVMSDSPAAAMTAFLDHQPTRLCVEAERAFLRTLNGGCQVPIAAHAHLENHVLDLSGLVARPDGTLSLRREASVALGGSGDLALIQDLGRQLAQEILDAGGRDILETLYLQA